MLLLIILLIALAPLAALLWLMRAPKRRTHPAPRTHKAPSKARKPYTDLTPIVRNLNPQR
jgi:flagellar basal body-associated protein FliL